MLETHVALPSKPRIVSEEDFSGVYEIDGLYPGYGHTLGNSLRRIILSSLPGAAITQVKIDGVSHEFSTIPNIKEDVISILLNLKHLRIAMQSEVPLTMQIKVEGAKMVTAAMIDAPSQITILNPEHHIAELTDKNAKLEMEITVENGLGYVPREVHQKEKMDIGAIALDAVFTPIRRVNYEVENMRVGDRTDYNRLRVHIETDGTLTSREALEQSVLIMIHQLKAIVGFQDPEPQEDSAPLQETAEKDMGAEDTDILKTRVEALPLSGRTANALSEANIRTVGGLVRKRKDDILALDGIGPKGLDEVLDALKGFNLTLKE